MKFLLRCIILCVLTVLPASCTNFGKTPPVRPPAAVVAPADLLDQLREHTARWHLYEARVHIRGESPKGKFRLQAVILADLPGRFRLEAMNPFGQTVGLLLMKDGKATLWVPSEKILYTAERAQTLVEHFLGVPIPLEVMGYSLSGSVPPDQLQNMRILEGTTGPRGYSETKSLNMSSSWEFSTEPVEVRSVVVKADALTYTIGYSPSAAANARDVPGKIDFSAPQWRLEITVDQMLASQGFQEAVFQQPALGPDTRIVNPDRLK